MNSAVCSKAIIKNHTIFTFLYVYMSNVIHSLKYEHGYSQFLKIVTGLFDVDKNRVECCMLCNE